MYRSSVWHGTICVYYLVLSLLRGFILLAGKKAAGRSGASDRISLASAVLLLLLNGSLVVPVSIMVIRQKPVGMTLIPAIAMAAYTTYKIVTASINLKRKNRSADSLVRLLRTIGFVDALVSILSLQNTLIMINMKGAGTEMLILSAITSAAVMAVILVLSVCAVAAGIRRIRQRQKY